MAWRSPAQLVLEPQLLAHRGPAGVSAPCPVQQILPLAACPLGLRQDKPGLGQDRPYRPLPVGRRLARRVAGEGLAGKRIKVVPQRADMVRRAGTGRVQGGEAVLLRRGERLVRRGGRVGRQSGRGHGGALGRSTGADRLAGPSLPMLPDAEEALEEAEV